MKKLALILATTVGAIGSSPLAWAQYEADSKADLRFYLSPMATYNLFDSTRNFDDDAGMHLAIGKILGRGANMEIYGSFTEPMSKSEADTGGELTSYGLSVMLFQARDSFPLYGILSIGKGQTSTTDGAEKLESDQFDVGFGYLVGLGRWPLIGRGAALRMEARYRFDKFSQSEANRYDDSFGTGNDRSYHDAVFGLGLMLPLGGDPNRPVEVDEPEAPAQIIIAASDSDGDQIPDDMDACPDTAPGVQIDVRGCERDSDKDGVVNSKDECPNSPAGSVVGDNGCPPDSDGDGVPDAIDMCLRTPAGKSVLADGCALNGDCRIPIAGQRIDEQGCAVGAVTLKGVNFSNGNAELNAAAKQVLDTVARALQGVTSLRIEVGGHTDSQGSAQSNQRLSELRAAAVKAYLEDQGVPAGLLSVRGYGETQPIADNSSAAGREANRRVELIIQDKQ